jgi:lactoylglutathione lyase
MTFRQPFPELRLRPFDDRANGPQRIIQVERNGANAMQNIFRSGGVSALSSYNEPQFNRWVMATMKYLHTMVRVTDLDASLEFYCKQLGLSELRRYESEQGRFTLVFLAAPGDEEAQVELTWNWDPENYDEGRNFGHLAYSVDDIYEVCQRLLDAGVTINRPPHDGHMAFVRSPDNISIELLQNGDPLPAAEPWKSMGNSGHW